MREIKFRAWSKTKNKMFDNITPLSGLMWDKYEKKYLDTDRVRDLVLMQYTGLKDSKGVEIYEGDIVQKSHGRYKIGVVVFRQGAFCFESRDNGVYAGDERFTQLHTMHYTECNLKVEYKVIGNIYEHSYLLEQP